MLPALPLRSGQPPSPHPLLLHPLPLLGELLLSAVAVQLYQPAQLAHRVQAWARPAPCLLHCWWQPPAMAAPVPPPVLDLLLLM